MLAPNGGILRPFQKGHSGNPQGLYGGSGYHEARRICAQATPDAARKQVELMSDPDSRVAFMATEAVLRCGAGAPPTIRLRTKHESGSTLRRCQARSANC